MDREEASDAVHEALPARWHVGPPSYDPGVRAWSVTARGPHPGRGNYPQTISRRGEDEPAALRDLDDRLRGDPPAQGSFLEELRQRLRLAYVDSAEQWTRENLGRALNVEELAGVLRRYDGP